VDGAGDGAWLTVEQLTAERLAAAIVNIMLKCIFVRFLLGIRMILFFLQKVERKRQIERREC
jgi:hypothetical protein